MVVGECDSALTLYDGRPGDGGNSLMNSGGETFGDDVVELVPASS